MQYKKASSCPVCAYIGISTNPKCVEVLDNKGQVTGYGCRTALMDGITRIDVEGYYPNSGGSSEWVQYFNLKTSKRQEKGAPILSNLERLLSHRFKVQTGLSKPFKDYLVSYEYKDQLHRQVASEFGLTFEHARVLQKRGLYSDLKVDAARTLLNELGFCTFQKGKKTSILPPFETLHPVAGFDTEGYYQTSDGRAVEGIGIPRCSATGELLAWQIKPDRGKIKYKWACAEIGEDEGINRKHDPRTGKRPLSVACFSDRPERILIVEGSLKSILVAYFNKDAIVLSGDGGSISCSRYGLSLELDAIMKLYPHLKKQTILVAPDARSAFTSRTLIAKTIKSIVDCGYTYGILDWGQLFEGIKGDASSGDPDEISSETLKNAKVIKRIVADRDYIEG